MLSQQIRDFAVSELGEPDNASYRRYADLRRPAAIWNVVAAPELSLEPKTWCFAVVGCVGYRGYYDAGGRRRARRRAARRKASTSPSIRCRRTRRSGRLPTGGWLADPLLNTFIDYPEGELARLVFHELAHQIAFAPGDTLFNESFASAVEKIGVERWLAERAGPEARAQSARGEARRADFRALTERAIATSFARALRRAPRATPTSAPARPPLLARLRADYATMKATRWGGYAGYDDWFARANNAAFGVLAQLHRARARVRAAVRARRPRLPALLCRGQADRRAVAGSAERRALSSAEACRTLRRPADQTWPTSTSTARTALGLAKATQDRLAMGRGRPRRSSAWSAR